MAYGDKPKRQKDDMGNKGRRSGKGPKPMKGAKKASRESAKQERKNLITENPVVNRSNDSGFDYTQSKKDIKKRYKKMDKGGSAPALNTPIIEPINTEFLSRNRFNLEEQDKLNLQRFQGSTKPLGNTKAMNAMMKQTIQKGLSADLGTRIAQSAVKTPIGSVSKAPSMTAPKIKQPLAGKMKKVESPSRGIAPALLDAIEMSPAKTTGSFKPSERDMALKEAHLGTISSKAGGPVKPPVVTKEGPKPQKPKSKSKKPKGKPKYTKSETVKAEKKVKRGKRTIKAKF